MNAYQTSPIKHRRTRDEMDAFRAAILAVAGDYERMSIRQLFYQLVARGVINKTERTYKQVCDLSAKMRVDGSLDYRKVVDGHRSRRVTFAGTTLMSTSTAWH